MKLGNIPTHIKMYARAEVQMKFKFDDIEVDDFQKVTSCFPIFVADAANPKTQKTGFSWASQTMYDYSIVDGKRQHIAKEHPPVITERQNTPIRNIRLIGLEHRGNGGRAYKALVDETYVFDFREDVLLDAILNGGILDNGILPGEYIFAQVASEMKLIRVGSLLHEKMIEATDYWKESIITKFEVGGVYKNKVSELMYLGTVYTSDITIIWPQSSGYYGRDVRTNGPLSVSLDKPKKVHLFVEHDEDRKNVSFWNLKLYDKLPKSFRIKTSQRDVNPHEFIENVKNEELEKTSESQLKMWLDSWARCLNISPTPGYVHPKVQEYLTK